MSVTEEEAKAKWCPFVRIRTEVKTLDGEVVGATSANRHMDETMRAGSHCLGSACMAWRWGPVPHRIYSGIERPGWEYISDPEELIDYDIREPFWREPEGDRMARRQGYCGLAGRPS